MNHDDWAAEAHYVFSSYHEALAQDAKKVNDRFPEIANAAAHYYKSFLDNPVLGPHVNLSNWQSSPFELLEHLRGWQPFLRRLTPLKDGRVLTLARRNLALPLSDANNQTLVSRHFWVVLEGLRHAAGLYTKEELISVLKLDDTTQVDQQTLPSLNDESLLSIQCSPDGGRHVCWNAATSAQAGDVLWKALPYATSIYDFDDAFGETCFHCAKSFVRNVTRELTLVCPQCNRWSYCSHECRQEHEDFHLLSECPHVLDLLNKCRELGLAPFKGLLVLRAALKLRQEGEILSAASTHPLLNLETHAEDHATKNPKYTQQALAMSEWIVDRLNLNSDKVESVEILQKLFFAININAIGLGKSAVGLFEGMPSMLNHSCLENVTHCWNNDDAMLYFRSCVSDIDKGQECCFSYVTQLELPTSERTASLQQYKFFTCRCERCQSKDELGRCKATLEYKTCLEQLELGGNSLTLYPRLVELAEIIFPKYHVTKGWALEECAHALKQDMRLQDETNALLLKALKQYQVCRGDESSLVARVRKELEEGATSTTTTTAIDVAADNDNDDDLLFADNKDNANDWTLFEIKTFEPDQDLKALAAQIKQQNEVEWADGYRTYSVGFGIQTLILACKSGDPEMLAQEVEESFEDTIQHVDILDINH